MESTNLHQFQDLPPAVDASTLSTQSCYGVGSSHSWTPNIALNAGNFDANLQEANPRSRALTHKNDIRIPPRALNGSMIQDLGYHHRTSDAQSCLTTSESSHDLGPQFAKTKERTSDTFPKFSEMLTSPSSMEGYLLPPTPTTTHMKNEHKDMNALSERLLLKTLFSGDFYSTSAQNYPSFSLTGVPNRGNFSQIYPSINISNLNHSSTSPAISSSLDTSTQSLDLLTSSGRSYSGGMSQHSQDNGHGRFTENLFFGHDHMQHPTDSSSCNNSTNSTHFTNGLSETKRTITLMESKASQSQSASKKSRLESRPTGQPFKVRKEKLGDRIAALQQLVAPFGKTDTASVLMEAIGYIKFLESQIETLSVPYMKSSRNRTSRVIKAGSAIDDTSTEPKQDLRSRGLCLVPLPCMSYIAGDGGSGDWHHPNFGGAT